MAFRFCIPYFLVFECLFGLTNGEAPVLRTNIGEFEGKLLDSVEVFYGLPFAQKPGRFEKPLPPLHVPIRRDATVQGPECHQVGHGNITFDETSDDCLYLNLFKPHKKSRDGKGYALLIFIHGGAYRAGSAAAMSLDYMAEQYVTKEIVYIVVQYRLGFGSGGDSNFAGNYGLWDVRQALLWVRENAQAMDFDLNRITLWGYSSGASIVSHFTLSKQTRDLFAQAIQSSGSGFNEWSLTNKTVETTRMLAEKLGCRKQNGKQLKECLQLLDDVDIMNAAKQIPDIGTSLKNSKFSPRIDNDFFTGDTWTLLSEAPPKPTLTSNLENEFLLFVAYDILATSDHLTPEERLKFNKTQMEQILRDDWFTTERYGEKAEEALKKVSNFYLERQTSTSKDYRFYVTQYAHFLSDLIVSDTLMREIVAKTQKGWPVYTLLNRHRDNLNRNYPDVVSPETVHSSDNIFMFGFKFLGDLNFTRSDFEFRDLLVGAVVEFVKSGDPNGNGQQKFVKATKQSPFAYTELDSTAKIKNGLFEDVHNFWEAMIRDYKYDIIFGVPLKT